MKLHGQNGPADGALLVVDPHEAGVADAVTIGAKVGGSVALVRDGGADRAGQSVLQKALAVSQDFGISNLNFGIELVHSFGGNCVICCDGNLVLCCCGSCFRHFGFSAFKGFVHFGNTLRWIGQIG